MTQNPYSQPPQPQPQRPSVPYARPAPPQPTTMPPRRSAWPTVIGVISIVFASLGLLCVPVSLGVNCFQRASGTAPDSLPGWLRTYNVFSQLLGLAMAVLLLVAGIQLLKRRPAARTLHLVYAGIGIVMGLIGAAITVTALSALAADMPPPARVGFLAGAVAGTVFGMAWPVFLLAWFLRGSIAEEVRSWSLPAPPHGGPYAA